MYILEIKNRLENTVGAGVPDGPRAHIVRPYGKRRAGVVAPYGGRWGCAAAGQASLVPPTRLKMVRNSQ